MTKRMVVLMGAGASHDVANYTFQPRPEFRPPLATGLFQTEAFWNIAKTYVGMNTMWSLLAAETTENSAFALEERLSQLLNHHNVYMRRAFKAIPLYLRDLLSACSLQYVPHPETYARLVVGLIADHPHQVDFLTLNYDTLLEQALSAFTQHAFNAFEHYISSPEFSIVKLHGSINWWGAMAIRGSQPPNPTGWWAASLDALDLRNWVPEPDDSAVMEVPGPAQYFVATLRDERVAAMYPLITAPLIEKTALSFRCPPPHVDRARQALEQCDKVLIIGCSGWDSHVLELMNTTLTGRPLVSFVGAGTLTGDAWNRFIDSVPALALNASIFDQGFKAYVSSSHFRAFLEA
ncbi:MAG: SIR2 family protein [Chloroflexi bacterium]|nr:SIR2 family protein [Chloroflexota bacterium]